MAYKSIVVASGGTVLIPAGVSVMTANIIAGGGGGGGNPGHGPSSPAAQGEGGGSGAEFALGVRLPVVPNTSMTVVVGAGGAGGIGLLGSVTNGQDGGESSFAGFSVLGGNGALTSFVASGGQVGGGPNGGAVGIGTDLDGKAGSAESPTCYGGTSSGSGESLGVGTAGAGGQVIGQYPNPGTPNTGEHPGGGGGCSPFGSGGAGSTLGNGSNGSGSGTGGGGASGTSVGVMEQINGGNGTPGFVQLFYSVPTA